VAVTNKESMTMEELRKWAVEQAIKLHGGHGPPTEKIIEAADKMIAYVKRAT
jgi:hypothetical protein